MFRVFLKTKRRWNWKVFIVLVGLNIAAIFALMPYQSVLQSFSSQPAADSAPFWKTFLSAILPMIGMYTVFSGLGLLLANRIGLGLPFVEGWARREPVSASFRTVLAIAWIAAVCLMLAMTFLSQVVFDPPLKAMLAEMGIAFPKPADIPPLVGILASSYGGIAEETFTRLFGLSLVAWLGSLLFHDAEGRPKLAVLWVANILFALYFGIGHLQSVSTIGWPMDPLVIARTLVLNGIGGLVFGWLFWRYGLESAMLAHFLTDVINYGLVPFVAMWQGETARIAATAGVAIVVLLALAWAVRSLLAVKRSEKVGAALKAA